MDSRARRFSCPSSGNVVQKKKSRVSLNDMSTEFDHVLSTGSLLRRVCLTCHTPLTLSARKCKSCKSKLVIIWYRRVDTTGWRNPRRPPIYIPYPRNYAQCKYFLKGEECVNNPCCFAHGKDELEIWELYRSRGNFSQDYTIATNSISNLGNVFLRVVARKQQPVVEQQGTIHVRSRSLMYIETRKLKTIINLQAFASFALAW